MLPELSKIKGVHPGAILRRELKLTNRKANEFSQKIGEYSQTLSAIMKEKRRITPLLSIKLGNEFGVNEDYFFLLQAFYDMGLAKKDRKKESPNLEVLRPSLFWDTDITQMDWDKMAKAVIRRVFERGNELEKKDIIRFYGTDKIDDALSSKTISAMILQN